MNDNRISGFQAFFDFYLRQHTHPVSRGLHYAGTILATILLPAGLIAGVWWLVALAPLAGYGPAWIGHFAFERNKPATFRYPLWSLMSDYYMLALAISGRLSRRLHQLSSAAEPVAPPPEKSWPSARVQR